MYRKGLILLREIKRLRVPDIYTHLVSWVVEQSLSAWHYGNHWVPRYKWGRGEVDAVLDSAWARSA